VAFFGKTDNTGQVSAPDRPAEPAGVPGPASQTVVGPKARFVGDLFGDEDILIQGRVEGNVRAQRRVTVAPSGEVEGDVAGRSVVVSGKVHGQIRAEERAELAASATVQGNVHAPKVIIAEGAQLQGNVAMSTPEEN
jgi:cytoskeletal protein CcmA (bactofilin family)